MNKRNKANSAKKLVSVIDFESLTSVGSSSLLSAVGYSEEGCSPSDAGNKYTLEIYRERYVTSAQLCSRFAEAFTHVP